MNLANVKIVLVEPSHPGNIGAAARAMKTMGLAHLTLVSPKKFPHQQAIEMASGAVDVLEQAVVVNSFKQAISDAQLIIGSSARVRELAIPMLDTVEFAEKVASYSQENQVAVVFGRERTGLTNEELGQCHYHVMIDTNPAYSSLNLAQAVQLLAYELRKCFLNTRNDKVSDVPAKKLAKHQQVESFYQHFQEILIETSFINKDAPKKIMPKIRRMFNRIQLQDTEVNMLRGILTAISKYLPKGGA